MSKQIHLQKEALFWENTIFTDHPSGQVSPTMSWMKMKHLASVGARHCLGDGPMVDEVPKSLMALYYSKDIGMSPGGNENS